MTQPRFPSSVNCLTPGCKGRAEPEVVVNHKKAHVALYVCPNCQAVTLIGKSPLVVFGSVGREPGQGLAMTLAQEQPEVIRGVIGG